jgi:hypothetical protein
MMTKANPKTTTATRPHNRLPLRAPTGQSGDRWETAIHALLSVAVGVALVAFFNALMHVTERGPSIAQSLSLPSPDPAPETLWVAPASPSQAAKADHS